MQLKAIYFHGVLKTLVLFSSPFLTSYKPCSLPLLYNDGFLEITNCHHLLSYKPITTEKKSSKSFNIADKLHETNPHHERIFLEVIKLIELL